MIEYSELNNEQKLQIYNSAFSFLHDHSDHVHSLFDNKTPGVPPSGSDLFKPELWKGIHWKWFIEVNDK